MRRLRRIIAFIALVACLGYSAERATLEAKSAKQDSIRVLSQKVELFRCKVDTLMRILRVADPSTDLRMKLAERACFYGLRAELLFDCAQRESQWDTTAVNRDDGAPGSDSYGLLQVKLTTARWILSKPQLTAEELLRVDMNIEAGTRYLKYCLEEFGGDEVLAVAAYRSGPTAVRETLKDLASK